VRGANCPTSKSQPPRAKAPWDRDFARACHDGPDAIVRHTAAFFAFAAALSLTNCKGFVREMWGRAMRGVGVVAGCVALAVLVSGCDTTDSRYFRYGIGTDLYSDDIVQTTQFQDIYLTELCRQALPVLSTSESQCLNGVPGSNGWNLLVQAGLNDVDRRCDSYLAWLDDRRRTNNAVLKELGDVTVASQAIMNVAGVSANPITLVGLAFGLAANTFTNVNSRLLLEVDKTTVQTLVLRRRSDYRVGLQSIRVENRPAAVHALRSYLNICTPFTIETDINSTITVFQQVGAGGLVTKPPLVSAATVGAPVRATERIGRPVRATIEEHPEFAEILDPYDPQAHSVSFVSSVQRAMCVPKNEIGIPGAATKALIAIFEASPHTKTKNNGKLDAKEIALIRGQGPCVEGGGRNFFEKLTYPLNDADGKEALMQLIVALNKVPGGPQLATTLSLDDVRDKINQARADPTVSSKLKLQLPPALSNQVTKDFLLALPR
jgi:hypothetical protein